jgi:hypothetical protein
MQVVEFDPELEWHYCLSFVGNFDRRFVNVSLSVDLSECAEIIDIVHVGELRVCSLHHFEGSECPYPYTDNDTEIVANSWARDGEVITWRPLDGLLPKGKAASARFCFKGKPGLRDGMRFQIRAKRGWEDRIQDLEPTTYVVRCG